MADDITSPSNTTAKMRWEEPYVSDGLNLKLNGLVPAGVVRGGKLGTSIQNSRVTIEADPDFGDSVYSFITANGHQITFRQLGNVVLDLDQGAMPGTTVYIGLEIDYLISAVTTVKWRGYLQAEVDADPTIVVLGSAIVPAVAALIPLSDISEDRRRVCWQNISHYMRDARQIVKNGSFEMADDTVEGSLLTGQMPWPYWDRDDATITSLSPDVSGSGSPQVGDQHLHVVLSGIPSQELILPHETRCAVRGGETVQIKFWIKSGAGGVSPAFDPAGHMGVRVRCASENPDDIIQDEYAEDITLSGVFDTYQEIEHTFRLHEDVRWIQTEVHIESNGQNSTGTLYLDDIRVFVEQPNTGDGSIEGFGDLAGGSLPVRSLDIVREMGAAGSLDDFIEHILSLRWGKSAGVYEFARRMLHDFVLRLREGRLEFTGTNDTEAEASLPRIKTNIPAAPDYQCVLEMAQDSGQGGIRFYASDDSPLAASDNFSVTLNAAWNGTEWNEDFGGNSLRLLFLKDEIRLYIRENAAGPWADNDWNDAVDSFQVANIDRLVAGFVGAAIQGNLTINSQLTEAGLDSRAKIEGDVGNWATSRYTMLAEFESELGIGSYGRVRLYAIIWTGGYQGFAFTSNARFRASTQDWVKDDTGSSISFVQVTPVGFNWYRGYVSTSSPFGLGDLDLMFSPETHLGVSDAPPEGCLIGSSGCKAWGLLRFNNPGAGDGTLIDGFNIDGTALACASDFEVDFLTDLDNDSYVVVILPSSTGAGAQMPVPFLLESKKFVGGFDFGSWELTNTGDVISHPDADTMGDVYFHVAVFGRSTLI